MADATGRSAGLAWLVWSLAAVFVVLNYVQQVFPNLVARELADAFASDNSTLGHIAAAYFVAYAVCQIPVGLILDRFGTRKPLALAILMAGLGAFAFALSQTAANALLARVLMGASSAFSFLGCLKLVQAWFPVSKFSTLAGITNTAAMLGAASGAPLAWWVDLVGWRTAMAGMGAVELLLAVLTLLIVRDRPQPGGSTHSQRVSRGISLTTVSDVLRNRQVWLNAAFATGISLIFVAFGGLWGASFIRKAYGLDTVAAAHSSSMLFLGGIVGSVFFGWWSDHLNSRVKPMRLAAMGGCLTLCLLLYIPDVPLALFKMGLFLMGFFSSANIVAYAVARDLYPRDSGFSIGLLSTCFYAGSALSQPLVGLLLEYHARDHAGPGIDHLTVADYRFALSALVVFMAVALVSSLRVRETLRQHKG